MSYFSRNHFKAWLLHWENYLIFLFQHVVLSGASWSDRLETFSNKRLASFGLPWKVQFINSIFHPSRRIKISCFLHHKWKSPRNLTSEVYCNFLLPIFLSDVSSICGLTMQIKKRSGRFMTVLKISISNWLTFDSLQISLVGHDLFASIQSSKATSFDRYCSSATVFSMEFCQSVTTIISLVLFSSCIMQNHALSTMVCSIN